MSQRPDPTQIEPAWQQRWDAEGLYRVDLDHARNPYYNLTMFPYPSSAALHVGHVYCYGGTDTYGRYLRLTGHDVFEPMGFDAFGIHAENYALKIGEHPQTVVPRNIQHFRDNQMKKLGTMFDWSRQVDTTDPNYYKWTQWLFLQMREAGLVERRNEAVDWCPGCKTVLANEQVIDGACERCGSEVEQKPLEQWFFKITDYADRLLADLDKIDWPARTKALQTNWIGKKTGIDIHYRVDGREDHVITCFTTRPETNFGATFVVLAPEHELVDEIVTEAQRGAVEAYRAEVGKKNELERTDLAKEKTGVFTGAYCINDLNGERMPIWVGDFVLAHFGTGAVVGVPAHDIRDFEFAQMAKLPVKRVLMKDGDESEITQAAQVWEDDGVVINSDFLDGMGWQEAREAVMDHIEQQGWGERSVSYRLHDWLISRQRYWGPPIPMIHCEACAARDRDFNVLILHGTQGSGGGHWLKWLRERLESAGVEVMAPDLPDSAAADYAARMAFLNENFGAKLTERTIVIGHSSGAAAALQVAEQYPLRKLILVAPYPVLPEAHGERFKRLFGETTFAAYQDYLSRPYDKAAIAQNVGDIVALFGGQDAWADAEMQAYLAQAFPVARQRVFPHYEHITQDDTGGRFSEILSELPPLGAGAGWRPVPTEDLPVRLPELDDYEPEGNGRGPLAKVEDWVNTTCPDCGGPANRETDVSDTFLDSAWYQLRYPSVDLFEGEGKTNDQPFDPSRTAKWLPVDMYIGGIEHATMHLLYFRFVTKVLHDLGHLSFDEPAKRLRHQGMIIKDGAKMSKSRGNVVNPDEYIVRHGADAFRTYMLFIGPYEEGGDFNDQGILGVTRFFDKLWDMLVSNPPRPPFEKGGSETDSVSLTKFHQTIKKVGEDIEAFQFNTAIAALMELSNWIKEQQARLSEAQWVQLQQTVPVLLAPFAPHLAEEMWQTLGYREAKGSVHSQTWPSYDESQLVEDTVTIVVQVNGKNRDEFTVARGLDKAELEQQALGRERIQEWTQGNPIRRVIVVPDKLVNVVV